MAFIAMGAIFFIYPIFAKKVEMLTMRMLWLILFGLMLTPPILRAQCTYLVNEYDEFDSTQIVSVLPLTIGYIIPSAYTEADGEVKMVEEGKLMFSYTENDSLGSFFLTIAALERNFYEIAAGREVMLLLNNGHIIPLLNVPDRGRFDESTNMRLYQHVCVVPIDVFYSLTVHMVEKIRINYKGYKRTITLTREQQTALRKAIRCVGQGAELYPIRP